MEQQRPRSEVKLCGRRGCSPFWGQCHEREGWSAVQRERQEHSLRDKRDARERDMAAAATKSRRTEEWLAEGASERWVSGGNGHYFFRSFNF